MTRVQPLLRLVFSVLSVLLSGLPGLVSAQTRRIEARLVAISGENGLSPQQTRQVFFEVARRLRSCCQVDLKLRAFTYRSGPTVNAMLSSLGARERLLRFFEAYFARIAYNTKIIKVALLPPIRDNGLYYISGYATSVCAYGRANPVAYANGQMKNRAGEPRFEHSVVALLHEIMHLLGASHDLSQPPSVMHPDALRYLPGALPVSGRSINEIRQCVR